MARTRVTLTVEIEAEEYQGVATPEQVGDALLALLVEPATVYPHDAAEYDVLTWTARVVRADRPVALSAVS